MLSTDQSSNHNLALASGWYNRSVGCDNGCRRPFPGSGYLDILCLLGDSSCGTSNFGNWLGYASTTYHATVGSAAILHDIIERLIKFASHLMGWSLKFGRKVVIW